jgi:DNA-binding response OmpR family regulator
MEQYMGIPTVLVAEADLGIRALLSDVLGMEGYQVQLWDQPALSSSSVAAARPDLLVIELMPATALRTLALLTEIQRQPAIGGLRILVITTNPLLVTQHGAELRQLGCTVLLKPFDLDDLINTVKQPLMADQYWFRLPQ